MSAFLNYSYHILQFFQSNSMEIIYKYEFINNSALEEAVF